MGALPILWPLPLLCALLCSGCFSDDWASPPDASPTSTATPLPPTPSPTPTLEPGPSPTPQASPSDTPSPTPSPTEIPTPSPTPTLPPTPTPTPVDLDGDGYLGALDCDEGDPAVFVGADEGCDAVDNDCDDAVDEDFDADGDGFRTCISDDGSGGALPADCDDSDGDVYPGAAERCDAQDDDCDGATDEGVTQSFYTDLDGDGFGAASVMACEAPEGTSTQEGDCDDADPNAYPGAEERWGNGTDEDCDGVDPSADVYLDPTGAYAPPGGLITETLQEAVDAASAGGTVAIAPGRYPESVHLPGRSVHLRAMSAAETLIDGSGGDGSTLWARLGSGSGVEVSMAGLTVEGGPGSDPSRCGAEAEGRSGGGICLEGVALTLTGVEIRGGGVDGSGGGLYLSAGTLRADDAIFAENGALDGGGIYLNAAVATLRGCSITGNTATHAGAGIGVNASTLTVETSVIADNAVSGGIAANGGGMITLDATVLLSQSIVAYNTSTGFAGGLSLNDSASTLKNVLLIYNTASEGGGAIGLAEGSEETLILNTTVAGNRADKGGGIYIPLGEPILINSIVAFNQGEGNGANVYAEPLGSMASSYSLYFEAKGGAGVFRAAVGASDLVADPYFLDGPTDLDPGDDNYHLHSASPAINAGHPEGSFRDPDGTRNDLGVYGGPLGAGPPQDPRDLAP